MKKKPKNDSRFRQQEFFSQENWLLFSFKNKKIGCYLSKIKINVLRTELSVLMIMWNNFKKHKL